MLKNLKQQFQWLLDRYGRQYTMAIVFLAISDIVVVLPPWFAGYIADRIADGTLTARLLGTFIGLLFLIVAIAYTTGYLWSYHLVKAYDVAELLARKHTVAKIFNQSAPFFLKNTTGSLMGKATNDVGAIGEMAGIGIMFFFDATIYQSAIILMMAIGGSWQLTLLTVLPYPLLILFSSRIGRRLYTEFDLAQQAFDAMNDDVLENVQGVRVVRAFSMERSERASFAERADALYRQNMRVARLNALFLPTSRLIQGISFVVALIFGARLIRQGVITTPQLMTHVFYLGMLTWPMMSIGDFINISQEAQASMERINDIWNWREEITDPAHALPCDRIGTVTFDHFSFAWPGRDTPMLKDISLTIEPGMTLGVVGRVGSGKTAFLKQLLRFYPQASDEPKRAPYTDMHDAPPPAEWLTLDGIPIGLFDRRSIRSHIGYVPQQSILFSLSVRDNVALGSPDHGPWPLPDDHDEVTDTFWKQSYRAIVRSVESADPVEAPAVDEATLFHALRIADFEKDLAQLPDGLDTMTGERGVTLSGGQKQRLSIARAVLKDPEVLILDDCLSAVDAITEQNVLQRLYAERAGKTTLVSSHRLSAVRDADMIIVLDDGAIVARGTHDELVAEGGWYAEQYERQQLEEAR
ncbi:MAG: ABC transporter ATP-binding protein [Saccharofermentanales bacterium]|jgi:ATP-binding cassette subfamily B multidrug efflux pump